MANLTIKLGSETLADVERRVILGTLKAAPGQGVRQKVAYAANVLKIGQSTIYRKLNEYQVAKRG